MRAVLIRLIPAQLHKHFAYILRARSARKIAYAVGHVLPFLRAVVSRRRIAAECGTSFSRPIGQPEPIAITLFGAHWHL